MRPVHDATDGRPPPQPRPLSDVRVLAIEQYGAGPWGSLQLADMGAEVIKIEDPCVGGDIGRYVPPYQEGEDSLFFETFNRNKSSISLNLREPAGRSVLHDLVRGADAVYCNLRGDQPEALGITYDQLRSVNPRIVCCSLTGYGRTGPLASLGAYDYVIQARGGWMSLTGEPDSPPMRSGLSLVDYCGGYVAGMAMLGGLWQARRDGVGCDCDVSLLETALSLLTYVGTWVATAGYEPRRMPDSAHPSIVPFQNFATTDGFIVVACPKDHFWRALCTAIDRSELAEEPRFATIAARYEHRELIIELLSAAFATRPTAEWLDRLGAVRVPCARVVDVATALADPQVVARGGVVEVDHPTLGPVRQVASPLRIGGPPPAPERAPFRGEHTEELLASLCGYDRDMIADLARRGAFGTPVENAAAGG